MAGVNLAGADKLSSANVVARAATANALTQGVAVAKGLQSSFSRNRPHLAVVLIGRPCRAANPLEQAGWTMRKPVPAQRSSNPRAVSCTREASVFRNSSR